MKAQYLDIQYQQGKNDEINQIFHSIIIFDNWRNSANVLIFLLYLHHSYFWCSLYYDSAMIGTVSGCFLIFGIRYWAIPHTILNRQIQENSMVWCVEWRKSEFQIIWPSGSGSFYHGIVIECFWFFLFFYNFWLKENFLYFPRFNISPLLR